MQFLWREISFWMSVTYGHVHNPKGVSVIEIHYAMLFLDVWSDKRRKNITNSF